MISALSIAAIDPSAAAGLLLDVQVFSACGVHGQGVVTALTAQAPDAVSRLAVTPPADVARQLAAAVATWPPAAIKTGLVVGVEQARAIAEGLRGLAVPVVVDPVDVLSAGVDLTEDPLTDRIDVLAGIATLLTPNLDEAATLLSDGTPDTSRTARTRAARRLARRYGCAVLLKGGHVDGADVLVSGEETLWFEPAGRPAPFALRGTGCRLGAAIAAHLARGAALDAAIQAARATVAVALAHATSHRGQWLAPARPAEPADK